MELLALSGPHFLWLAAIAFAAGVVRGFTGFALSAVAMVVAVTILPPVEIIPMLWWLEMTASLLMVRQGWQQADRRIALTLVAGSALGLPAGLFVTLSIDTEVSKLIALVLVMVLAAAQLSKVKLGFLDSPVGIIGSGFLAGLASGLAGVGGMIVALFILALRKPAPVIRATLVLFLFASLCVAFFTHVAVGTMDAKATARGLAFALPTAAGVILGKALFVPAYERFYKPICLAVLIAVALAGIAREVMD